MIEDQNNSLQLSLTKQQDEFETVIKDMDKAKLLIERVTNEFDTNIKNLNEEVKIQLREEKDVLNELAQLESERDHLVLECNILNTEIHTLSSCYDFVFQLLPDDKQKQLSTQITEQWEEKFSEQSTQMEHIRHTDFETKKNFLLKEDVYDFRPPIDMDPESDDFELIHQGQKQVNLDIQAFLISADNTYEVISNIDSITAIQEKEYSERLDKQLFMIQKKQQQLNVYEQNNFRVFSDKTEKDKMFLSIYQDVLEQIASNSMIFTKNAKWFKNNDISYNEAINICLTAEQILEEQLNMIKFDKQHLRTNAEDSLIKQFNNMRKSKKGESSKQSIKDNDLKFSNRMTMYNRVKDKLEGLSKQQRPIFRSKPNDKKIIGEMKKIDYREEELADYIDEK